MTTLRVLLVCCMVCAAGIARTAQAFSLGELQLQSKPGQPFQAIAPVKLGKDEEISSVAVGSASDYALLNLPHLPVVDALTAQVKEQGGVPVVQLQSSTPIQEEDFFILLRVASNQHTFFPFFRLRSAASVANQDGQQKGEGQREKKGEEKRAANKAAANNKSAAEKAVLEPVAADEKKPLVEDGQTVDKSTMEKLPFFAMAEKALGVLKSSPEQKPAAPATGTAPPVESAQPAVAEKPKEKEKPSEKAKEKPSEKAKEPPKEDRVVLPAEPVQPAVVEKPAVTDKLPEKAKEKAKEAVAAPPVGSGQPATTEKPKAKPKAEEPAVARKGEEKPPVAPPVGAATGTGKLYGPVQTGENLTEIVLGQRLAKGNINFFQAVVALWKHNPGQFIQNNMNGLMSGAMLVIPSEQEIARVELQEARQLRLSHALEWKKPVEGRRDMPGVAVLPVETARVDRPSHSAALEERVPSASPSAVPSAAPPAVPSAAPRPPSAKPAGEDPGKGENEELRAILLQLQVITRVLESNQAQQDRMEQRIATLEQARKEWDFLRDRINELERVKGEGLRPAEGEAGVQPVLYFGQPEVVWMGAGAVGIVLLLGGVVVWLGRRWNRTDQWKSLQALLSATAQKDPQLLRDALQQTEPSLGQEFTPAVHAQKLEGVAPSIHKRSVEGDVAETVSKLQSMTGHKE